MLHEDKSSLEPLRPRKKVRVHLCWKQYIKKGGVLKYPRLFQCDYGYEFKSDVGTFLEKHIVDI